MSDYQTTHYLFIDEIKIKNANAITSPLTYGFPHINGFVGAVHALSRQIPQDNFEASLLLDGVLIACHEFDLQAYRPNRFRDYTFNQSRNPILRSGKTASIIEEGRVHLTVSLVVEVKSDDTWALADEEEQTDFLDWVKNTLMKMRLASGSIETIGQVELWSKTDLAQNFTKLLPAFILMEATNEMVEITEQLQAEDPNKTALDTLLETATLHFKPLDEAQESGEAKDWQVTNIKQGRGWLVPISVGYQAIYPEFEPGELENARTHDYPSQYVEALYSLGKWVFPHRLKDEREKAFWRYAKAPEGLFLLTQKTN